MKDFIEKISKIQRELKAPKSKYNSFGGYNYRSTEDILEAVKPLLAAEGLLLTISDTVENIGDRYYIKATASITDGTHTHSVSACARECLAKKGMDESQITGSSSTYARKYALNGLFCIDDTKDADTDEQQNERQKRASKETSKGAIHCTRCGQKLKESIPTKNKTYTASEYFEKFGGLCPECAIADYAARKNAGGE